ncbi:MAG: glutamine--fructose-6-phosphate transaminase (isomerizing) [Alphaproteobacteria bacterium]
MCGIFSIVSAFDVVDDLFKGLKHLEYRGYDSAGIVTFDDGRIECRRSVGKLNSLFEVLKKDPLKGPIGIGHTRWATHGVVSQDNAHPHVYGDIAVVHNGIIENFAEIKEDLVSKGYRFKSETDTEIIAILITDFLKQDLEIKEAFLKSLKSLKGQFSFVVLYKNHLYAARRGNPLILGIIQNRGYLASDVLAFFEWTKEVVYLQDGDAVELSYNIPAQKVLYTIFNFEGKEIERRKQTLDFHIPSTDKGEFRHFMLKEIFEQPKALFDTIDSIFIDNKFLFTVPWDSIKRINIVACGSSYYAGLVARYWFEAWGQISVDVEIASEYRYREPFIQNDALFIFISQSGETIDTLSALQQVKEKGCKTLAITNVPYSSIVQKADNSIITKAGPEIGVASTKAFVSQLSVLASLCLDRMEKMCCCDSKTIQNCITSLMNIPQSVRQVLEMNKVLYEISSVIEQHSNVFYLARGILFPIALEGALKLKELSYIHAEGYPAGELKHGPIALIDPNMMTIFLAPHNKWFEKTLSNIQEIVARRGKVICLTDPKGAELIDKQFKNQEEQLLKVILPICDAFISPFLYTVAVQLLSYYTAFLKGHDIDKPRNLAKSVTVE